MGSSGESATFSTPCYDFGVGDDGTLYHVMELLRGRDLDSMVREYGPMPAARVVPILLQICDSLDDAHRAGLVHRDIKPSNLFLSRRGRRVDYARVLDFGLVKSRRDADEGTAPIVATAAHVIPGTPAFMAPEIASGEQDIDRRADLYALGCVAYWLLTGRLVFEEPTPIAMALAHCTQQPVPPSQRAELAIPRKLEAIVLSCLAKAREDRPASAMALAEALRAADLTEWSDDDKTAWWTTHMPELLDGTDALGASAGPASTPCASATRVRCASALCAAA